MFMIRLFKPLMVSAKALIRDLQIPTVGNFHEGVMVEYTQVQRADNSWQDHIPRFINKNETTNLRKKRIL